MSFLPFNAFFMANFLPVKTPKKIKIKTGMFYCKCLVFVFFFFNSPKKRNFLVIEEMSPLFTPLLEVSVVCLFTTVWRKL